MNWKQFLKVSGLIVLGAIGGLLALLLQLPLPFLLGSLLISSTISIYLSFQSPQPMYFPQKLRKLGVGIIGAMIGATFTSDFLTVIPSLWLSLLSVVVFVVCAQIIGFVLLKNLGRYNTPTAIYASLPGGLIEAITLGEQAGGDVRVIALQHFIRIIFVVSLVPTIMYFWLGEAVGSAANQSLFSADSGWFDVFVIIALTIAGSLLGSVLRIPAPHLIGAMFLSGLVHITGVVQVQSPFWLLSIAQVVVGVSLGLRFSGMAISELVNSFVMSMLLVSLLLGLAFFFAWLLQDFVAFNLEMLFISLVPGGITEMSLIALSLGISPVVVVVHHLFRIIVTVFVAGFLARHSHK